MEYPITSFIKPKYTKCSICMDELIIESKKISNLKKCENCKYDNRPFGWLREKQKCSCFYKEIPLYIINCDYCTKTNNDDENKCLLEKFIF